MVPDLRDALGLAAATRYGTNYTSENKSMTPKCESTRGEGGRSCVTLDNLYQLSATGCFYRVKVSIK